MLCFCYLMFVTANLSVILFLKKLFPLKEYLKVLKRQNYDTATSGRDFLPDNCLLNLEDDDTLDLVTDVSTAYYSTTNNYSLYDLENLEKSDSDSDSNSDSNREKVATEFERREDIAYFRDVSDFSRLAVAASQLKASTYIIITIVFFFFILKG